MVTIVVKVIDNNSESDCVDGSNGDFDDDNHNFDNSGDIVKKSFLTN